MVGTLIVAAAAGTTAAGVAASFALTAAAFAVNFAVSLIVTRIFGDKSSGPQDNGVRQQVPPSASNAIPIVYGDAYLGGTFVDAVLTTNQKTMYYVLAISSISPNGQFTYDQSKFYYGDRLVTFDNSGLGNRVVSLTDQANNVDTKIDGNLFIYLFTSNAAGTITPINTSGAMPSSIMSIANGVPSGQQWTGTRQMNGLAFAIVQLNYNRDADTTSLSPITFKVRHYLNGTGVAKPGDVWQDYITNVAYGGAIDISYVDTASVTALNTYSDEVITYTDYSGNPSTQPRYRVNGVLDAGETVLDNIDKIMAACDSWMTYNAASGKWSIVVNKTETAIYSFDDTNIIGEIRVSATDITSSINQVEAKFPFKDNKDQPAFVTLQTPANLLYPNEPVNKLSLTFDLVNNSVQAQYLANRLLEQAREDLIVSFSTTYYGIQVDAGDVISVTNADYGWSNKLFRVTKVNEISLPDGSLGAKLDMSEYNAQVYDNFSIIEFTPSPNSNIANPGYFSALAAPTVTSQSPTATIPHFNVGCVVPTTGRVTQISLFYTTVASPTVSDWTVWSTEIASNSQPFTPSSTVTFTDINLPQGVYYFAFKVSNENSASILSPLSAAFTWNPTPVSVVGSFLATFSPPVIQVPRTGGVTPVFTGIITQLYGSTLGGSIDFVTSQTDTDPAFVNNTWRIGASATTGNGDITTTGGLVLGALTDGGTYAQWAAPTAMTSSPATLNVPVRYKSATGVVTQGSTAVLQYSFLDPGPSGSPGTAANQYASVYLYQWATSTPSNTSGTSTYTWATGANTTYTGTGGWSTTIPTNPGTPLIRLWVATKQITAPGGTTVTSVDWTTGVSIAAQAINGATGPTGATGTAGVNGLQTARPTVYQWALSTPAAPTGTSVYTWASSSFTPTPAGWSQSITASPSPGFTLWSAVVPISDTATASTTTINWSLSFILASGYAGANGINGTNGTNGANGAPGANGIDGLSSRICYAKSTLTSLNSSPAFYVTTGAGAFPPFNTWGGAETWQATPPTLTAGEALFQSDGIYNPATTQTTWNVPYLSNLKVGSLSAITTNTGNLSVTGTVQAGSAFISGTSMGGSGGVLYASGEFAFGNSASNISYNGSQLTLNGNIVACNNLQEGTTTTQNNNTFGFGTGSAVAGIATVGFFKTTRADTLALGALSSQNVAMVGSTVSTTVAGGFGNRNGVHPNPAYPADPFAPPFLPNLIDELNSGYNRTLASFTAPSIGAFIQKRLQGGNASYIAADGNTYGYCKIAFEESGINYAFQAVYGPTGYYTLLGTPSYALYTSGPVGPFTGSHDGLLDKNVTPTPGDILIDLQVIATKGVSDTVTTVEPSSQPNQKGVIGVYVGISDQLPTAMAITVQKTVPGIDGPITTEVQELNPAYNSIVATHNYVTINSVGEGLVNVCGENGDIAIGDLIVTSSTTGKGMKQGDDIVRSITVAKSREAVTFASPTDVKLISCIYLCG
jgi:hypothetical protein